MKFETKKKGATSAFLSALMLAGVGLGAPSMAAADEEAAAGLQFIIVSDDLRKTTTETERVGSSPAAPGGDAGADGAGDGNDGNGNGNNGHGNNLDGVDVSNPGQGNGGPNGAVDASGDVDDEAGGGGSNGNGKGKNKNK